MKKLLIVCLFSLLGASGIMAQNDDEMKKWMEYMTPGKEHQEMADLSGNWTFETLMWMDPTAEPSKSQGTATIDMLLDGRYQRMNAESMVMGMPYKGMGITGFDNAKKTWQSMWIDNMGTGIMFSEGTYDKDAGGIVFKGKSANPITGKDEEYKEIMKFKDNNNFKMEMYMVVNGKEYKSMEMIYTRK